MKPDWVCGSEISWPEAGVMTSEDEVAEAESQKSGRPQSVMINVYLKIRAIEVRTSRIREDWRQEESFTDVFTRMRDDKNLKTKNYPGILPVVAASPTKVFSRYQSFRLRIAVEELELPR